MSKVEKAKVGEGVWAVRGIDPGPGNRWLIIGAPTPAGQRFLTVAPEEGGPIVSYPEAGFHSVYHRVDTPDAK